MRRYAGDQASHVVVLAEPAAGRARPERRWGRAARREAQADPGPHPGTRATVIDAAPVSEEEARSWLEAAIEQGADAALHTALEIVNRTVHGHAIAAGDPYVCEVALHHARLARLGFGDGEDVADGHWTDAVQWTPAAPSPARHSGRRPGERLAALLAGRDVALAAELLVLRARLDFEHGRTREAALQLEAGLAAALAELESWRELGDLRSRLEELRGLELDVRAAAAAALRGGLQDTELETVRRALGRLDAALQARTTLARG